MPKESPTMSSLWTGPQNPCSGAGQATAVPTQPWQGALVSRPPGPPVPQCPHPQGRQGNTGRAQPHTGPGHWCCPPSREQGGMAARHLPPGTMSFGGIRGAPGAATAAGIPQHSAWDLGTSWHPVPNLKPSRNQGGMPRRRGSPACPREGGQGEAVRGLGELWQ